MRWSFISRRAADDVAVLGAVRVLVFLVATVCWLGRLAVVADK